MCNNEATNQCELHGPIARDFRVFARGWCTYPYSPIPYRNPPVSHSISTRNIVLRLSTPLFSQHFISFSAFCLLEENRQPDNHQHGTMARIHVSPTGEHAQPRNPRWCHQPHTGPYGAMQYTPRSNPSGRAPMPEQGTQPIIPSHDTCLTLLIMFIIIPPHNGRSIALGLGLLITLGPIALRVGSYVTSFIPTEPLAEGMISLYDLMWVNSLYIGCARYYHFCHPPRGPFFRIKHPRTHSQAERRPAKPQSPFILRYLVLKGRTVSTHNHRLRMSRQQHHLEWRERHRDGSDYHLFRAFCRLATHATLQWKAVHRQCYLPPRKPTMRGGARIPFNTNAVMTSTLLLSVHNLTAVHNYAFVNGDCFFDSLEYLTGIPSQVTRRAAVKFLKLAVARGDESAIAIVRNLKDNSTVHSRGVLTFQQYTSLMARSAANGGLWADATILEWTARALNIIIHTYRLTTEGAIDHTTFGLRGPPETTQDVHLLFTGPQTGGHYTPALNPNPSVIAEADRFPNRFKAPPAPAQVVQNLETLPDADILPPPHRDTLNHIACIIADEELPMSIPSLVDKIRGMFPQPIPEDTLIDVAGAMQVHVREARAAGFNPLALLRVGLVPDTFGPMQARDTETRGTCPEDPRGTCPEEPTTHSSPPPWHSPRKTADLNPPSEPTNRTISTRTARPPRPSKNQAETPPGAPGASNLVDQRVNQASMKARRPTLKERLRKTLAQWLNIGQPRSGSTSANPKVHTDTAGMNTERKRQTTIPVAWQKPQAPPSKPVSPVDATGPVPAAPFQPSSDEILTLNVMGILSHEDTINATLNDTTPKMFALTETHTKKYMHHNATGKRLRTTLFAGYRVHFSSAPQGEIGNRRHQRNKGGIVLGVSSDISGPGTFERVNSPAAMRLNGYILHCTLRRLHPTLQPSLNMIGIYMPEDMAMRRNIYAYIRSVQQVCEGKGEDLIVLGDFNAVLHPEGRSGILDAADKLHRQEASNLKLHPMGNPLPSRVHTYRRAQRPTAAPYTSRIDDILIWNKSGTGLPPMPERVVEPGGSLDHQSLLVALPCQMLPGLASLDQPPGPREPGLAYPIKKGELEETKRRIGYTIEIHDLWASLRKYREELETALQGDHSANNVRKVSETYHNHHDSHATVDRLGHALAVKGQEAHKVMMDTCTKASPPTVPRFTRTENKKFRALLSQSKELKHFLASCTSEDNLRSSMINLTKSFPDIIPDTHPSPLTLEEARELAHTHLHHVHLRMANFKENRTKRQKEAARSDFQSKLARQPRKIHRTIFQDPPSDDDPQAAFPEVLPGAAFHDGPPDGTHICTDPKRVIEVITEYFTGLFAPGHVVKTGKYLPKDREAGFTYPWERPNNPDNFKLAPPPGHMDPETSDLLELILDPHTLRERLRHIGRSKMPGPDRIPNELLKSLPEIWHEAIHDMFIIMWITGRTPASWTESTTILLYKKGDKFLPQNYRPIGLAGAIYKLWTSTVTHVMLHHALRNNTLHVCQEGGILQRNTQRQLQNLMNAFDDAHHFNQDLFLTYLDFSSAFNMCDHDQLLRTMYDMGVPPDAIEVVKDIYAGHRTSVSLPVGSTSPITVTRGTIQGDPLSPLLFLFYIEPLLRWLHVGGRGYTFASLDPKDQNAEGHYLREVYKMAALGFIDDTTCLTHSREDMEVQLRKVEAFSAPDGFNLPVNSSKSATTAILYGTARKHGGSPTDPKRLNRLLTGNKSLTINNKPIPFLHPNQAYKYLGMLANPGMDWSHQLEAVIQDVVKRGRRLASSMASPRQCWNVIKQSLRPKITYAFGIVPYTMQEIGRLDRTLAGIARRCCRLPRSTPTTSILLTPERAGMGMISLVVDYATIAAQTLTMAMNDQGRLGATTRALLSHQIKVMGGAPVDELPTGSSRHCTCLRKLTIMDRHGLELTVNGQVVSPYPSTAPMKGTAEWGSRPSGRVNSTDQLALSPDGWFVRLLRHPGVSPSFMAPLLSLGIRHIGQLVTANGTHLITSSDLALLPGVGKVTKNHKQALNRLTVAVCGVYPSPNITLPTQVKTSEPLPTACRTLPHGLSMPTSNTTRQGTLDIRQYLSRVPAPRIMDPAPVPAPPIAVNTTKRVSRKSLRAAKQRATHALYSRASVKIGKNHLSPIDIHEKSQPGALATFWQQCQTLTASIQGSDTHITYWRNIAADPSTGWDDFCRLVCLPPTHSHSLPIEILATLYNPQFAITGITNGPLSYKYEGMLKECYLTSWRHTVVLKHHLPMIETAYNHKSTSSRPIDPTGEATSLIRASHTTCLVAPHLKSQSEGGPTDLPVELVVADWEDLYVSTEHLELHDNFSSLLHNYRTNQTCPPSQCPPPLLPPPTDTHLPEHVRQGIPSFFSFGLHLAWEVTRKVRTSVSFALATCNPDLDIVPPQRYTLQEGLRRPDQSTPLPHTMDITFSHTPSGQCVGRMTNLTTDSLRAMYEATAQNHPAIHAEMGTTFEKDVARLLMRYDPDQKTKAKPTNPLTHPHTPTWALSDRTWESLRNSLGITRELFASPLDRSLASATYWSAHPEDQLFGANHDAFSLPWSGPCQAFIGDSPEANDTAIRHALGSVEAYPDEETCILMFIPSHNTEAPHLRHLKDPRVTIISEVGAGESESPFRPPGHWRGPPPPDTPNNPRLYILAIATTSGAQKHLSAEKLAQFYQTTGFEPHKKPSPPLSSQPKGKIPRAIQRMKDEGKAPATPRMSLIKIDHTRTHLPCTHTLATPTGRGCISAYTDGSCIKYPDGRQSIGAAVYFPDTDNGPVTITINPKGKGVTLTINRAELSGINQALQSEHSVGAQTLHIYTDSGCSLHLITRILNTPWTVRDSKHHELLTNILDALKTRADKGQKTVFHKVKSHIGIEGNERADKGAREAAKHPDNVDVVERSENSPFANRAWVALSQTTSPTALPSHPRPPTSDPYYVSNLTEDIKRKITPSHSGGQYSKSGCYANLWHATVDTLHPNSVSRLWSDNQISWYQATLAFKARWGQLYTNKLAFRYGRAPDPMCPICKKAPDSVGHLLGGCQDPTCKAMAILRHNEAVRILQRTISKSSRFGGCYCVMDACPAAALPTGVDSTRLPGWLLPEGHPYASTLPNLRPDLVFIEGLPSIMVHGKSDIELRALVQRRAKRIKVHIIEAGYCADTSHAEKDDEKAAQHTTVVRILTGQPDPNQPSPPQRNLDTSFDRSRVLYHPPVTLGRTGTLPASLITTMKNHLGVSSATATECMSKLTRHAVHYVEKFYKNRYATMGQHGKAPHGPKPPMKPG